MRNRKQSTTALRRQVSLLEIAGVIAADLDNLTKDELFAELVKLLHVEKRTAREAVRMTLCHLALKNIECGMTILTGGTPKVSHYHVYGAINATLKVTKSRYWQETMRRKATLGMGRNYTALAAVAESDYLTEGHFSTLFENAGPDKKFGNLAVGEEFDLTVSEEIEKAKHHHL